MGKYIALGAVLGALLAGPAHAGGVDVSTDAIPSDDVVLVTYDGTPLDINGDGDVDLAVASNAGGVADSSRYYYGNGDGTFSAPELLSEGASSEIAAGDLNGDTFADLVQGRRDLTNLYYLGDSMAVAAGVDIAPDANHTSSVALGDLDLDGDLDVATGNGADMMPQPNRYYLTSMTGGGTLSFTGADISPDADVTRSIVLADIDGDDDLDVLAGNDGGGNRLYLNLISIGTGVTFAPGPDFGDPGDRTSKILVGDLDLDGNLDVVTLNLPSAASSGVNRFFINTSFGLNLPEDVSPDTDATSGGALADFDGDGDLDLAVANLATGMLNQSPRNRLYLNQFAELGEVSFAAGIDISADEHNSRALAAADLNGDQALDIIVGNESQPDRRYLNNGTADPFTNVAPVIDDQAATLRTNEGEDLTISLAAVTVTDPDNVFPEDFTLTAQPGANYTASGATITPDPGFAAALLVPVVVNDGTDNSAAFSLTVSITPAPRSGGGGGGGAFGIVTLLALVVFLGLPNRRRKRLLLH